MSWVKTQNYELVTEYMLKLLPTMNKRFFRDDEVFKSEELFPSHIQILMVLSNHKQLTMSEISKQINVINSNLTPLVDKLIKMSYLKRQPYKKDRRVVHISLTPSGKAFVEKHKKYVEELLTEKLEKLTDEQVAEMGVHLKALFDLVSLCLGEK